MHRAVKHQSWVKDGIEAGRRLLLLLNLATAVAAEVWFPDWKWMAGVCAWGAVVASWPALAPAQRWLCFGLSGTGLLALALASTHGTDLDFRSIVSGNALLLAMLTGLAFLRSEDRESERIAPRGPRAYLTTMVGITGLGGLINIAAMVIVGDRMSATRRLGEVELKLLSRAYSIVAVYSPFIGGMALALHLVPGASLMEVWRTNMLVVVAALAFTFCSARLRTPDGLAQFEGYGFNARAMAPPFTLAVAVLVTHGLAPQLSVLAIIAACCPLIGLCTQMTLTPRRSDYRVHVLNRVGRLGPEAAMFMSAGLLAQGLSAASASALPWSRIDAFDPTSAAWVLVACVVPSFLGVHPIVPLTVFAGLIVQSADNSSLIVATFALAWGIGCTVNPFSGITLTLQGRYRARAGQFLQWNSLYTITITTFAMGMLTWLG